MSKPKSRNHKTKRRGAMVLTYTIKNPKRRVVVYPMIHDGGYLLRFPDSKCGINRIALTEEAVICILDGIKIQKQIACENASQELRDQGWEERTIKIKQP